MKLESSSEDQGIFVFQLDKNNYIKFCPERGGVITNWVSDGNEILYFDEKRFMDKTKSIRGGIPILFPICGNLNTSSSVFGKDYLQLSQQLGNEKAIRAVASANGANALALFVPCHRVIGTDGALTGYAGGIAVKQKLLDLEGSSTQLRLAL